MRRGEAQRRSRPFIHSFFSTVPWFRISTKFSRSDSPGNRALKLDYYTTCSLVTVHKLSHAWHGGGGGKFKIAPWIFFSRFLLLLFIFTNYGCFVFWLSFIFHFFIKLYIFMDFLWFFQIPRFLTIFLPQTDFWGCGTNFDPPPLGQNIKKLLKHFTLKKILSLKG